MSKYQRAKGKRGEREVAQKFLRLSRYARRGASQSRSGSDFPDVVVPGFQVSDSPLWVEVKIGKRPPYRKALEQATKAAREAAVSNDAWLDAIPLAACRVDGDTHWVAVLWLDDLLDILSSN